MNKTRVGFLIFVFLLIFPGATFFSSDQAADPWKAWLAEVRPIMSQVERSTFAMLQTEEDRQRFREMFWRVRDPNPKTPENEYQAGFLQRSAFARANYGGINSDRGKIYVILGKPTEIHSFSGYENLVECELWIYQAEGRPGLLPFMNLLFFRQRDMGDMQLFYPGIHTAADLLTPNFSYRVRDPYEAFKLVREESAELAQSTLSVIPGEGDPHSTMVSSSSSYALNKIYTLPEREAELSYLKSFQSTGGFVSVAHSTRQIRGDGDVSISRADGLFFLNYSLMPDVLSHLSDSPGSFAAIVKIHLLVEDAGKNMIFQNERKIDLKFGESRQQEIASKKIVFREFEPIIPGEFDVTLTFVNESSQEFFSCRKKVSVGGPALPVMVGFNVQNQNSTSRLPYQSGNQLLLSEPRRLFTHKDTLTGMVFCEPLPEVWLQNLKNEAEVHKISAVTRQGDDHYQFSQPLNEIKDGDYRLVVRTPDGGSFEQVIYLLPAYMSLARPFGMDKSEPASGFDHFLFILGQEHLNAGQADLGLGCFERLPVSFWTNVSIPVLARAHYLKRNYSRVLELLETAGVEKNYASLLMLANSALETKLFAKAVAYLEELRRYGDTVEINQLLAAASLSLGDRAKATVYLERARRLQKEGEAPKP